jgi:hypothetical protein
MPLVEPTNLVTQHPVEIDHDTSTLGASFIPDVESFCPPINSHLDFDNQNHGGLQMFFDSSMDTQGLSDELDWLFGTISPEQADNYEPLGSNEEPVLPSFSPHSTNSHHSLTDVIFSIDGLWVDVREKILLALQGLLPACLESSFFEPNNLEQFYRIYFANYNTHFPILHEASFSCSDAPPLLLLSILTLGATLSDEEHFKTSEIIHDKLRWLIFSVSTLPQIK